jgi:effector-binding domain-containing protein
MWKKIVFGCLATVILLVIVGFLLPEKVEVSRSISINAPAEYSYEEVDKLENWNKWSYWNTQDPAMQISYGDKRMGAGAFYAWVSNDMGNGKLTITESVPFQTIKVDLDFMEDGIAKSWYNFDADGDATKLTMNFLADMGVNPLMRWVGVLMVKPEINRAFDYNLHKLKVLAESKPTFTIKIMEETVPSLSYVGIRHTMSPQDPAAVGAQMNKMFTELTTMLKRAKVAVKGNAFCMYPSYNEESMEFVCALPVDSKAKLPSSYKLERISRCKAVKGIHVGNYSTLESSHAQVMKYMEFRSRDLNGSPWEVYVTGPSSDPDPSKWITEIYYPINQ